MRLNGIHQMAVRSFMKELCDLWVAQRLVAIIRQKVLLGHISHILRLLVFCEQMVEGLIFVRTDICGNGFPPLFRVAENRVDSNTTPRNG